jgi:speckle-type POZ protein
MKFFKKILLARSVYFARMFDSDFKEAKDKIIEIQEENEDLFKLLIKFLYSNDFSTMTYEIAIDLIALAQKYNMPKILMMCGRNIVENLNAETCIDILIQAEIAQCDKLERIAKKFIIANLKAVCESKKWAELEIENSAKALEITKLALNFTNT